MLAFIDTETYEVLGAQTGDRKDKLTMVTGPADLAKKFTGAQLSAMSEKLRGKPVSTKVAKATVVPLLWDAVVAQAKDIQAAPPEDLTDLRTPHADAVPDPENVVPPGHEEDVKPGTGRIFAGKSMHDEVPKPRPEKSPGQRPRLKSFRLNDVNVDISTLPPQAAIIAQGLLKEAKAGVTQMDHDVVIAFLDRLGLKTKQEPWRIFRYYHRNIELLGIISPLRGDGE